MAVRAAGRVFPRATWPGPPATRCRRRRRCLLDLEPRRRRPEPSPGGGHAYPWLPEPQFGTFLTHAESLERGQRVPGTTFQIATYAMPGNTGTYLDASFHRHPQGADIASLPLQRTVDPPRVLVDATSI